MDGDGGGGGLSFDITAGVNGGGRLARAGIELPMNLRSAVLPAEENRRVVDEMDFFLQEKRREERPGPGDDDPSLSIKKEDLIINTGLHLLSCTEHSSVVDGLSSATHDQENDEGKSEMAAMKAKLTRMEEENQKLRNILTQMNRNYNSLQMQFIAAMQQNSRRNEGMEDKMEANKQEEREARQFMDLGPGLQGGVNEEDSSSEGGSQERSISPASNVDAAAEFVMRRSGGHAGKEIVSFDEGRMDGRGLMVREQSPEGGGWSPVKAAKPSSSPSKSSTEQTQEATMRKARVSVRARSEAPMITDGCQWRKYGQKMAKGNPCPRAYYRCTMAAGCPVRKQVQRCAEDRTILITTYEGKHNHPLPPAAMAMASTTSAAASMLLSGSMQSTDGLINPTILAHTMFPCSSSIATISASAPFPTITLDLTHSATPLHFQKPQTHFQIPNPAAGSTSSLPQIFGQSMWGQSRVSGLQSPSDATEQKGNSLAEMVIAATAAITADPNFTAALSAAITSIIGGSNGGDSDGGAHQAGSNRGGSIDTKLGSV